MTSPLKESVAAGPPAGEHNPAHCTVIIDDQAKRRNVVYAILATVIGGLVGIFPFLSGLALFLDPAIKKRAQAGPTPGGEGDKPPERRVASVNLLPAGGVPVQVPIIADQKDIWTVEPNQPIGAVYLRKTEKGEVECLNAICPHAGCFVAYSAERKIFQCPCHTSAFTPDGERILPSPSPRDMDKLEVRVDDKTQDVYVRFANYYPAKEHMERKP